MNAEAGRQGGEPLLGGRSLEEIAHVRAEIRSMLGRSIAPVDLSDRPVVVIVSSSRSYSSLLFTVLRSTQRFVALPGEHTHLYKLAGLSLPLDLDGDDALTVSTEETRSRFLDLLSWELGLEQGQGSEASPLVLGATVAHRMYAQWSNLPAPEEIVPLLATAIEAQDVPSRDRAFLGVLRQLDLFGVDLDPRFYDIDLRLIARFFPDLGPLPHGPLRSFSVEESPFVHPDVAAEFSRVLDGETKPLLLKASVDAYRLDLLHELFGDRLTVIHLTRNPAGAICGLLDGWRSHCFASHLLSPGALRISGYSDTPWGAGGWWRFDAPPGWQNLRDADLLSVCAHQWASAHIAVLESAEGSTRVVVTVRGEDLVNGRRQPTVDRILEQCGVSSARLDELFDPVVMATVPPRLGRWRERGEELRPAVESVRDTAEELGYFIGEDEVSWT